MKHKKRVESENKDYFVHLNLYVDYSVIHILIKNTLCCVLFKEKKPFYISTNVRSTALYAIHAYQLTFYPRRGSRGFSDIPPKPPRVTKII
jgi:hypothetical protein